MDIQTVSLEPWPTMQLPREEVKATLQYLAHKTKKPVSFRWYTEGEGYSPQSVSVRVLVHDGIQATYSVRQVKIADQTHPLAPEQKAAAMALIHKEWRPNVPVLCQVSEDQARIGQYEKEVAEKVKAASRSLFGDVARQGSAPALLDEDPCSDYFGTAYSLFDEEDTAEIEAVRDDPDAFA